MEGFSTGRVVDESNLEITVLRSGSSGTCIYLSEAGESEHLCIGCGIADSDTFPAAIKELEARLKSLREMQAEAAPNA